jgi:hypothetical protein
MPAYVSASGQKQTYAVQRGMSAFGGKRTMEGLYQEIREAMEIAKTETINEVKAEHFKETLKLNSLVQTLQRQLDEKNANALWKIENFCEFLEARKVLLAAEVNQVSFTVNPVINSPFDRPTAAPDLTACGMQSGSIR